MKKDILFIIPSLNIGGGEKSLVNLLQQIDYENYNVDLFLINKKGVFLDFLPKEVNILDTPRNLEIFNQSLQKSILKFLINGKLRLAFDRIIFFIGNRKNISVAKREQYTWKYMKSAIGIIDKNYDVAIGYLEKTSNYICADCIKANKKVAWIHTDYNKLKADKVFDEKYFSKFDYVVTVSDQCKDILSIKFVDYKDKIRVIENIVSSRIINKLSKENISLPISRNEKVIVSVGRLSYEKGFDIAVQACKILKSKGLKIKWILVGDGQERNSLEEMIYENGLKDEFLLVGSTPNPYKYLAKADIYVQPSRYEGKSIAIDEAKILYKPIVATNFSTIKDQLTNNINGIITEMNSNALSNGIESLIINDNLYTSIVSNLKNTVVSKEKEIYKLYELIEN
ncbi:glycosyltransferase [Clostridium sp. NSJ-6]|uniref:Glycosyltransferase n=1 Tax=Clostridium hominis TaxID=2763036 RepID=A0ABR7DGL0_9CLOT|nr:glycosyltransferase [Clostridium hominis]MBC5630267.1 glycosyltransferase [Clostridium hominis]